MKDLDIHTRLKQARKELNLNQIEIARELSIQQKTISEIENGKILNIPNTYIYYFYKKGISLDWLYDKKGSMMDKEKEAEKIPETSPLQLDLLFEKLSNSKAIKTEETPKEINKATDRSNEALFERLIDAKDLTINSLFSFIKSQENQVEFLKTLINRLNK